MILATSNVAKQLLYLSYLGRVTADELEKGIAESAALLKDLKPGFSVLVDLERLESMDKASVPVLGRMMEMVDEKGVGQVVRVIPDSSKDIGLSILTFFHYKRPVPIVTCETMAEAAKALGI
jgi:hypothetical protein